jgi:hypothetical protein
MSSDEANCWLNGTEAFDYLQTIQDPVVRSLMHLVHDALLRKHLKGEKPVAPLDLLYCFRMLHDAFSSHAELYSALKGGNPDPGPPDWI